VRGTGPTGSRGREQESALVTAGLNFIFQSGTSFWNLHGRHWLLKKCLVFFALKTLDKICVEFENQPDDTA